MLNQRQILQLAQEQKTIKTADLVQKFQVSRQYASLLVKELVADGQLVKSGSTAKAFYVLPEFAAEHAGIKPNVVKKRVKNEDLQEHEILQKIETDLPQLNKLAENIRSIFAYAFSEMFNNAIEHSQSSAIEFEAELKKNQLQFVIKDNGVGIFHNIMMRKHLESELDAINELLKGKLTTEPRSHSGEGIFFTSKMADVFTLSSRGHALVVNNLIKDVFVKDLPRAIHGTRVEFIVNTDTVRHLNDIFRQYTKEDAAGVPLFDKTSIKIKLYATGGIFVSRSQARRVLSNLDKFKHIVFDFDRVPMVGQAFADEVFRVFQNKHPEVLLEPINMAESVRFMIERAAGRKF